ncbi:HEAT repeat-containing protein 5B-like isoform X2 [Amphibalanus amphitrite]|uniref:HEAT repeat-containing protein 5B-like isoform X2 n=1 Tax=Amphibalanus amphitrite TaxID=1232801 RepID=UPI001C90664D|nr:HEAT repeat-containing protein 5B-like isoform X2 [Amphibalanus amphitrite]
MRNKTVGHMTFSEFQHMKKAEAAKAVKMMELSHSLVLNEAALKQIPESKRPVFVFEWLRFLDKVLVAAQKADIKECHKKLVEQLTHQLTEAPGPPTRRLLARCLATLFSIGDTFLLFDTVNKCNDILRNKDDSPSYLATKLAAVSCIGAMYSKLGRMMGRSYEETVQILTKSMRSAESLMRCEVMRTLQQLCAGMDSAAAGVHKDIYKVARHCMTDRVMAVRCAAAACLQEMISHAPFLYTSELESVATLCFRAFDGSNYEVRRAVARLLGTLVAQTQLPPPPHLAKDVKGSGRPGGRLTSLEEALGLLMTGFLRGGGGFLRGTGDMIKGAPAVSREVRVGITHSYVVLVDTLGGLWLERHLATFIGHILELAASPRAAVTHVDSVYVRKCVLYILHSTLGRMLGEKTQFAACKELVAVVSRQVNIDLAAEASRESPEHNSHQAIVCALQQLGGLVQGLGTAAGNLISDNTVNLLDAVVSVLTHPSQAARFAAAWCLRCICIAVPSHLTPLIDRCTDRLDSLRNSPEAVSGYTAALAALLGAVHLSPLGVPHCKGKVIFNVAEDLLRSAAQNSRLSLPRTQAGWLLIGAVSTLGHPVVRGLLPRMLLLWRNAFPRSSKELDSEKARGDAFTWQVTLEGRAGALAAMQSLLQHCPELVTEDQVRRLLVPLEAAITMLNSLSTVVKSYGQHLKAAMAMVRLRLYETLSLLPAAALEGTHTHLLRLLVAEFTLADNPANTTTSLLRLLCHADESVILGSWLEDTDQRSVEDQLQTNSASGSGALEHDSTCLYRARQQLRSVPGPLPLGVAVIDQSVTLFGLVFPRVANKHRLQMLNHFAECIKQAKGIRQEAIQTNIFSAVLSGLRGLAEAKATFGDDNVKNSATQLILGALTNSNPTLRCAAGEALGRMAQVVGDPRFIAEMAQNSFDRLKSARDVISRTGHSLALGCLHRYVGSMGSSQHLTTSVSILLALGQDMASPVVQVWALHALALIAESGGPMFRTYVEPTLALALRLLLEVPAAHADVHQCVGMCLAALITTVGPELQGNSNSIAAARSSLLCACAVMLDHSDGQVRAAAMACLQQLHMFAPRHVNLSTLVPTLCMSLCGDQLSLRRAAISCLRQLAQREAHQVCRHAASLAAPAAGTGATETPGVTMSDTGLPGVLFGLLDTEQDERLISDIHDTLNSMMLALIDDNLALWLRLCKDVLTTSVDTSTESEETNNDEGGDDDMQQFTTEGEPETHPAIPPRWPTRVFAAEMVRKMLLTCEGNRTHFDLALAKEAHTANPQSDWFILHLSDLVRVAFMAATSDSDPLRLAGLDTLHQLIDLFSAAPDPEVPGHLLLEQYQAQVSAALRPAFAADTPCHVTARACHVCSAWIGSGVARDLADLRRVHQLLVSSLAKLKWRGTHIYNESAMTLEKLAILKAWAEVYIVAMREGGSDPLSSDGEPASPTSPADSTDPEDGGADDLLSLVRPELANLAKHWLAALKDQALLSLPPEFNSQLPHDGGAFYTMDTVEAARPYYRTAWPAVLHAAAIWLDNGGFDNVQTEKVGIDVEGSTNLGIGPTNAAAGRSPEDINTDRFHLLFGICMEALCNPRSSEPVPVVVTCLRALCRLVSSPWPRRLLSGSPALTVELLNVQHRLLLTRESPAVHLLVMKLVRKVITAAQESLEAAQRRRLKDLQPANREPRHHPESDLLGEGGAAGDIVPGQSVVFALLEVCLCLLTKLVPALNTAAQGSSTAARIVRPPSAGLSEHSHQLLMESVAVLEAVPSLCSPRGALAVLPTVLLLTTSVLRQLATKPVSERAVLATRPAVAAALRALRVIVSHRYGRDERVSTEWCQLLESALAKVIDMTRTCSDDMRLDEVTMLLAMGVFILHAPPSVVRVPALQYPCVNEFTTCLQAESVQVRLHCVRTLRSLFGHQDRAVSTPYIQALAPRLLQQLHGAAPPASQPELQLQLEQLAALEQLVTVCDPAHRVQVLGLYVPVLARFLLDGETLPAAPVLVQARHEHCLEKLNTIGPQYPQEFKALLSGSGGLRQRLEKAVVASQSLKAAQARRSEMKPVAPQAPSATIKLSMDFSNFT